MTTIDIVDTYQRCQILRRKKAGFFKSFKPGFAQISAELTVYLTSAIALSGLLLFDTRINEHVNLYRINKRRKKVTVMAPPT